MLLSIKVRKTNVEREIAEGKRFIDDFLPH